MYRMNYKAIMLAFLLQIIAGMVWYASTPVSFLGRYLLEGINILPSIELALTFILSVFLYLLFIAWLLSKVRIPSWFGQFFLVIGIWLFIVMPNYAFVSLYFDISEPDAIYILSYGIVNCVIAAVILPLWRSSRSIFKS